MTETVPVPWPLAGVTVPAAGSAPQIRVRFCPSPTGNPHVGMVRTALFNWAHARHTGGTFVFRIEDTDSARDSEESYSQLLEALSWLRLDWDEGPLVGGPHAPYRQSERLERYSDAAARLLAGGEAYECFCTAEELEELREAQRAAGEPPGYRGRCRHLSDAERQAHRDAGREPVLRLRMPEADWVWDDLVRGEVRFEHAAVPDFVFVRSNGEPLYTLVNPVDDVLMGITHVLRGEDLLPSTPRQLAMYAALGRVGIGDGALPLFGHLPYVMGEGNKKLSKRDPQSSLNAYRAEGFVPEGLLNYLALLGWAIADDRDIFSMAEMAEAFDIARVNPSPARFDYKKARAINAEWIRRLDHDDLAGRIAEFLIRDGVLPAQPTAAQQDLLRSATPLVAERMTVLSEATGMLGFLFAAEVAVEPEARAGLPADAPQVLAASQEALAGLPQWRAAEIEAALRTALIEGLGLKPKVAFGPVRVAVSGRRVSPPLFESMELLGADASLRRIAALAAALGEDPSGAGV